MARTTGQLLDKALRDAGRAREDLRAARGRVRRYKGKAAKTRARNQAAAAERRLSSAVKRVDKYAERGAEEIRLEEIQQGAAKEWEIGASYGNGPSHRHVMVNVRIFKRSGAKITKDEAFDVARALHERGHVPSTYGFEYVNWRRGSDSGDTWNRASYRDWRGTNRVSDLGPLSGPLATVFLRDFRISPVKEDE